MKKTLRISILLAIIFLSIFYVYINSNLLNIKEVEQNIPNTNFNGIITFIRTWEGGEKLDIKKTVVTKVSLEKDFSGVLQVNGNQIFMSYKVKAVSKEPNSIDVFFESLLDEESMNLFKKGDYLFSVDFVDNEYLFRDNFGNFDQVRNGDIGTFTPPNKEEKNIKENTEDYNNKGTLAIENRYFVGETEGQKFHIIYTTVDYNADDAVCFYVKDNIDDKVQKCDMQFSSDGWFRIDLDYQEVLIGYGCAFRQREICKEAEGEQPFNIQEVERFFIEDFLNIETIDDFSYSSEGTYYGAKKILEQNGWLPIIPTLYEFGISSATTTPIDTEFPEISYCGSGRDAICTVDFQKGKIIKHLNLQHTESNVGWLVVGSDNLFERAEEIKDVCSDRFENHERFKELISSSQNCQEAISLALNIECRTGSTKDLYPDSLAADICRKEFEVNNPSNDLRNELKNNFDMCEQIDAGGGTLGLSQQSSCALRVLYEAVLKSEL